MRPASKLKVTVQGTVGIKVKQEPTTLYLQDLSRRDGSQFFQAEIRSVCKSINERTRQCGETSWRNDRDREIPERSQRRHFPTIATRHIEQAFGPNMGEWQRWRSFVIGMIRGTDIFKIFERRSKGTNFNKRKVRKY